MSKDENFLNLCELGVNYWNCILSKDKKHLRFNVRFYRMCQDKARKFESSVIRYAEKSVEFFDTVTLEFSKSELDWILFGRLDDSERIKKVLIEIESKVLFEFYIPSSIIGEEGHYIKFNFSEYLIRGEKIYKRNKREEKFLKDLLSLKPASVPRGFNRKFTLGRDHLGHIFYSFNRFSPENLDQLEKWVESIYCEGEISLSNFTYGNPSIIKKYQPLVSLLEKKGVIFEKDKTYNEITKTKILAEMGD